MKCANRECANNIRRYGRRRCNIIPIINSNGVCISGRPDLNKIKIRKEMKRND